jgi:hypothetical protein
MNRDTAVGTATGYGLDSRGVVVRVLVGVRFSLLHVFQTISGADSLSYPMGTGGVLFPELKWPGRQSYHSPPTNVKIKNTWIYISTPPYVFMA